MHGSDSDDSLEFTSYKHERPRVFQPLNQNQRHNPFQNCQSKFEQNDNQSLEINKGKKANNNNNSNNNNNAKNHYQIPGYQRNTESWRRKATFPQRKTNPTKRHPEPRYDKDNNNTNISIIATKSSKQPKDGMEIQIPAKDITVIKTTDNSIKNIQKITKKPPHLDNQLPCKNKNQDENNIHLPNKSLAPIKFPIVFYSSTYQEQEENCPVEDEEEDEKEEDHEETETNDENGNFFTFPAKKYYDKTGYTITTIKTKSSKNSKRLSKISRKCKLKKTKVQELEESEVLERRNRDIFNQALRVPPTNILRNKLDIGRMAYCSCYSPANKKLNSGGEGYKTPVNSPCTAKTLEFALSSNSRFPESNREMNETESDIDVGPLCDLNMLLKHSSFSDVEESITSPNSTMRALAQSYKYKHHSPPSPRNHHHHHQRHFVKEKNNNNKKCKLNNLMDRHIIIEQPNRIKNYVKDDVRNNNNDGQAYCEQIDFSLPKSTFPYKMMKKTNKTKVLHATTPPQKPSSTMHIPVSNRHYKRQVMVESPSSAYIRPNIEIILDRPKTPLERYTDLEGDGSMEMGKIDHTNCENPGKMNEKRDIGVCVNARSLLKIKYNSSTIENPNPGLKIRPRCLSRKRGELNRTTGNNEGAVQKLVKNASFSFPTGPSIVMNYKKIWKVDDTTTEKQSKIVVNGQYVLVSKKRKKLSVKTPSDANKSSSSYLIKVPSLENPEDQRTKKILLQGGVKIIGCSTNNNLKMYQSCPILLTQQHEQMTEEEDFNHNQNIHSVFKMTKNIDGGDQKMSRKPTKNVIIRIREIKSDSFYFLQNFFKHNNNHHYYEQYQHQQRTKATDIWKLGQGKELIFPNINQEANGNEIQIPSVNKKNKDYDNTGNVDEIIGQNLVPGLVGCNTFCVMPVFFELNPDQRQQQQRISQVPYCGQQQQQQGLPAWRTFDCTPSNHLTGCGTCPYSCQCPSPYPSCISGPGPCAPSPMSQWNSSHVTDLSTQRKTQNLPPPSKNTIKRKPPPLPPKNNKQPPPRPPKNNNKNTGVPGQNDGNGNGNGNEGGPGTGTEGGQPGQPNYNYNGPAGGGAGGGGWNGNGNLNPWNVNGGGGFPSGGMFPPGACYPMIPVCIPYYAPAPCCCYDNNMDGGNRGRKRKAKRVC